MRETYYITDACRHCGCCRFVCPERCITAGKPHIIDEARCIGCGKCAEVCVFRAIHPKKSSGEKGI